MYHLIVGCVVGSAEVRVFQNALTFHRNARPENATSAKIILLPLLLPAADAFGVDRVQFGMIITLALLIGIATPPLGVGLYLMSAVSGVKFERLAVSILPLLIPPFVALILITAIPEITLWLPNLVMGPDGQ